MLLSDSRWCNDTVTELFPYRKWMLEGKWQLGSVKVDIHTGWDSVWGGRGVSCCVCAVVKLPSRLLAARRRSLADLGLSQCPGSPQTHSSAGWSRKPDPRLQGLSSKVC